MKKLYALTAAVYFSGSLFAQLPVNTTASNKKSVLEEFTGIYCQFCPDGHKIANNIAAANPGNFFPVNIHTGGYANPQAGAPDFRTVDGDAIANQPGMGITGYPQGAINRRLWSGASAMAHSRSAWATNAGTVMSEASYVNVAGEATVDVTSRVMVIDMEAYYTANGPGAGNKYTVMLLQDNINGPQTAGATYNPTYVNPDGTYRHMHMLRDVLNPTSLGDAMTGANTTGTTWTNQITYTVPAAYTGVAADLANLKLLIFITEGNTNIVTAAEMPIQFTGLTTSLNTSLSNLSQLPETCSNTVSPSFKMRNEGSTTVTGATVTYSINGGAPQTYNWTGSLTSLQSTIVQLPATTFTLAATNTLSVAITAVNGGMDEDLSNNAGTSSFNETANYGNTVNMTFKINQDRYGSETTWKIKSDAGTTVASGGPYSDLSGSGILLHTHQVVAPASGCYSVEILDAYGDGINSGYGAGNAELTDGQGHVIWSTNGVFGSSIDKAFKITSSTNTTGLEALSTEGFAIYPNPATDKVNVAFEAQNGTYQISIVDLTGRVLATQSLTNASGSQVVEMPVSELATGNYLVTIVKDGLKFTQKISVL
ncbi:MAG: T9SS type A sorting domain-containing protein [Bacteroidota bacterium]